MRTKDSTRARRHDIMFDVWRSSSVELRRKKGKVDGEDDDEKEHARDFLRKILSHFSSRDHGHSCCEDGSLPDPFVPKDGIFFHLPTAAESLDMTVPELLRCLRFFVLEMGALEGFLVCRTVDGSTYDSMSSYSSGFTPPSPGEEPSAVIVTEQDWIYAEEEEMEHAKPMAKQQQRPRHVRFVEWFVTLGKEDVERAEHHIQQTN